MNRWESFSGRVATCASIPAIRETWKRIENNKYNVYKTNTQTIPEKNYVSSRICGVVDIVFTDTADGAQSLEETNGKTLKRRTIKF